VPVSAYDFAGLVGGLVATWLFLGAVAISVGAALRLVLVLRTPGKGRWARGLVAGGAVAGLGAVGLFAASQSLAVPVRLRHALDRAAPFIALAAVAGGALAAVRLARRRARQAPASAASTPPDPGAPRERG
jgi:hypothetical protein